MNKSVALLSAVALIVIFGTQKAGAQKVLAGHLPAAVQTLAPVGILPPENQLQLALGLPVRDKAALESFVKEVADPSSPNFRKYLTPEQFTAAFGPTVDDYQAVINFAEAHGLIVTATHPNRLVVDVSGTVSQIEKTFHVLMRIYQHPTEARNFYAPDREPSIDQAVPILHIGGLDNYWLRRPRSVVRPMDAQVSVSPKVGSGPSGTYIGNDFRTAYVPGISLTGAGQVVGLLEFDGYSPSNIAIYESSAGRSSVPLQNVLVDRYSGAAGSGNEEVCLDIEMAIAMAPGLSQVIVYEAPNSSPWEDILSRMANDNAAKQLSCSWGGGGPDPTAEQIFQQMASQGQTFFNATGDSDAYTGQIPFPSDSPNVVEVGGTTLGTVSPGGAWSSETTWNWGYYQGSYVGSSGGISAYYSIPTWQQGINMSTSRGSSTFRNLPDVALTADNVYAVADRGQGGDYGGTSCAAPLWAAFTALVNQQAASQGEQPLGFLNPALYAVGKSGNYSSDFHDIVTGNNITNRSSGRFSAVAGYDLCTGWGTPSSALIAALVTPSSGGGNNYTVSTSSNPANGGNVTGAGSYSAGSPVTVTATANSGYTFLSWTINGSVVSSSTSYTFNVNADTNLVANFTNQVSYYTVKVSANPSVGGNVSGGGTFASGTAHTVYATPRGRYSFSGWTENGVVVSTSASYSFNLTSNRNLVAQFTKGRNGRHAGNASEEIGFQFEDENAGKHFGF